MAYALRSKREDGYELWLIVFLVIFERTIESQHYIPLRPQDILDPPGQRKSVMLVLLIYPGE